MTSKLGHNNCYVYITLPGQTKAVTAGRLVLVSDKSGMPRGRFIYGKSYLDRSDALEIDPIELKLTTDTYQTHRLDGIFGALRDAGPDYWGRRIIEKHCQQTSLSELDYLLYSPDDRAGALGFGLNQKPPAPKRKYNQTLELERLQDFANAVIQDENITPSSINNQMEDILLLGTSMGGARPKAVVEDHTGLWIAKFNRADDQWNQARIEHAMLMLAHECGINAAHSKVISVANRDVLLVKRFDRHKTASGYCRSRMVSALTLLQADESSQSRAKWSYITLVEELRRFCDQPKKNALELFKRICFNALISNIDDHPRNHAIIAKENNWHLSPAYDLTPATPISIERRELAMQCGDKGRLASKSNILSQHSRFLLSFEEACDIFSTLETQIKDGWYQVARRCEVSENDCQKIKAAFVYPGINQ